jgi:hypothetical protein
VWTAAHGKILTLDNLRKRRVIVVEWCCMCRRSGNLLIIFYSIAKWQENYGVRSLPYSESIGLCLQGWYRVLDCWRGQVGSRSVLDVWRIALLCLMWSIWRERNARCFEDCEKTKEELKNTWSNRFLVGLWRIISLNFLTFLNLWIFVLLLACKGTFFIT